MLIKRFPLLLLISILPSLIIAQNKGDFSIGPVFGVNYVTVVGDGIDSLNQQIKALNEPYNSIEGINSSGGLYSKIGFNAGFSLNIPIFNRFQTKNNVVKSYINRELSLLNLDNQKLQLQQTIEQAFADAKAASKTFEAATISLKSQREAFKNAQESYNLGASTLFDFDLVRTRLVSAESALIRAKYDFVFKTKVLQFYYGDFNLD